MKFNYSLPLVVVLLAGCKPVAENSTENEELLTLQDTIMYRTTPDVDRPHPSVIRVYEKLNFGNGYNSTTGQEYFGVLDFEGTALSAEIAASARGNRGQVTMEIVESESQLKTALNISAKADLNFKMGLWSSNNSLKLSTMRNTEFNSFSQHAILKASYVNEPLVLIKPQVKEELIALAERDPETFIRTCGDMFVSRIYTGGELYTLYSLNSRDSNEKTQNNLFFKTTNEYLGNTLDVTVEAEAMNESSESIKNINTTVITEGGFSTPVTTDMESYIKYANEFKEQVSSENRAVILYVELSPYENIAGFPKIDFGKIRVQQRGVLEASSNIVYMLNEDKNNADFVQEHPDLFSEEDMENSIAVIQRYEDRLPLIQKIISDCQADPDYCKMSDLDLFDGHIPFKPTFDFPEWEGERTLLPLVPEDGWVNVFENTGNKGMLLSIQGELEIRRDKKGTGLECYGAEYQDVHVDYIQEHTKTTGAWWWKKKHFRTIYKHHYYPHYKVRYIDRKTGQVLREFKWSGPVNTEPNVRVEMALANPVSRLQYWSNKKYHNLGRSAEEKLGYKERKPYFPIVRSCEAEKAISAIVSDIGSKPMKKSKKGPLMTAGSGTTPAVEAPAGSVGEHGYFAFKYD
ncbi:MAG: hypothetical protein WBM43_10500 [Flavobacteriaceae bacterium]